MKRLYLFIVTILLSLLFVYCSDNQINQPTKQENNNTDKFDFSVLNVKENQQSEFNEFKQILDRNNLQKNFYRFWTPLNFIDTISITGWNDQHTADIKTAFLEGYSDAVKIDFGGFIKSIIMDNDLDPANRTGYTTPYYEYLEGYECLIHSYVSPINIITEDILTPGGNYYVKGIERMLVMQAAGSNRFVNVNVFPVDKLAPNHFVTGAGVDGHNITGYYIEFWSKDPIYNRYSSFSNGYIGGELVAIFNTALLFNKNLTWKEVKNAVIKTSSKRGQWNIYDGYGKVKPLNALWYLFLHRYFG